MTEKFKVESPKTKPRLLPLTVTWNKTQQNTNYLDFTDNSRADPQEDVSRASTARPEYQSSAASEPERTHLRHKSVEVVSSFEVKKSLLPAAVNPPLNRGGNDLKNKRFKKNSVDQRRSLTRSKKTHKINNVPILTETESYCEKTDPLSDKKSPRLNILRARIHTDHSPRQLKKRIPREMELTDKELSNSLPGDNHSIASTVSGQPHSDSISRRRTSSAGNSKINRSRSASNRSTVVHKDSDGEPVLLKIDHQLDDISRKTIMEVFPADPGDIGHKQISPKPLVNIKSIRSQPDFYSVGRDKEDNRNLSDSESERRSSHNTVRVKASSQRAKAKMETISFHSAIDPLNLDNPLTTNFLVSLQILLHDQTIKTIFLNSEAIKRLFHHLLNSTPFVAVKIIDLLDEHLEEPHVFGVVMKGIDVLLGILARARNDPLLLSKLFILLSKVPQAAKNNFIKYYWMPLITLKIKIQNMRDLLFLLKLSNERRIWKL